ncbi:MAG: hypothetical protein E4G99_09935 [Anaerolineales bacterium]|nr:MAG: hypothetical protein E4G99_09935 [Anaerolineales bacterium]
MFFIYFGLTLVVLGVLELLVYVIMLLARVEFRQMSKVKHRVWLRAGFAMVGGGSLISIVYFVASFILFLNQPLNSG